MTSRSAEYVLRRRATMSRSISMTCRGCTTSERGRVSAPSPGPISTIESPARGAIVAINASIVAWSIRKFWLKRFRARWPTIRDAPDGLGAGLCRLCAGATRGQRGGNISGEFDGGAETPRIRAASACEIERRTVID